MLSLVHNSYLPQWSTNYRNIFYNHGNCCLLFNHWWGKHNSTNILYAIRLCCLNWCRPMTQRPQIFIICFPNLTDHWCGRINLQHFLGSSGLGWPCSTLCSCISRPMIDQCPLLYFVVTLVMSLYWSQEQRSPMTGFIFCITNNLFSLTWLNVGSFTFHNCIHQRNNLVLVYSLATSSRHQKAWH